MGNKEIGKIAIPKEKRWQVEKPRFNGFAVGHGVLGDTSYNRTKEKRNFKKSLGEDER